MDKSVENPKLDTDFHPMLNEGDNQFKGSGREDNQLHRPIVSVNPVSDDSSDNIVNPADKAWPEPDKFEVVENAAEFIPDKGYEPKYPIHTLELGQGLFIPTEQNKTTDALVEEMYPIIHAAKVQFSEYERDEEGDTMLEQVTVQDRLKNGDGTFKLRDGKIVVDASFKHRQKYTSYRNWVVKAVTKDLEINKDGWKAPADGVLVIRVL